VADSNVKKSISDEVIEAITKKLRANEDTITRASFGRLTWRRSQTSRKVEVDLEPKL
jgi:hypothetical protein